MLVAGKMSCVESHVIVAWLLHTCTLPALRFATAPLCLAATAAAAAVTTPRLWLTLDQRVLNCLKNLPQDENFKKWASKVAHNWPKPQPTVIMKSRDQTSVLLSVVLGGVRGLHQVGWILQIEIELFVSVEFHNFEQEIHLLESLKVWLWEINLATKNF